MRRLISNTKRELSGSIFFAAMILLAFWIPSNGQSLPHLELYVRLGIEQNLALRQQRVKQDQTAEEAREAFGAMLPSITFDTRYSEFSGDRLDFGDLINPAYAGLNQVTGQNRYPTNLSLKIPNKQETRLRLIQPILQPRALFGYRIRRELRDAESAQLEIATRDLIAEIKTAYFNYAKSVHVVELYAQTLQLLEENLRVSQKLVENQQATLDVVYRAKAELSDIEQKKADAERQLSDARRYFNFLLNRPDDDAIVLDSDTLAGISLVPSIDSVMRSGAGRRPEVRQIERGMAAARNNVKFNNSAYLPTVALAVDFGFQGENYRLDGRNDMTTVSVVASWNLFNGGQDRARRRQAALDSQRLSLKKEELLRLIDLQVHQAYGAAITAQEAQSVSRDRLESARRSFELVSRKYAEGMASQVEYLDARTNYTASAINQILTTYDFMIKYAQLERDAALSTLPQEITE